MKYYKGFDKDLKCRGYQYEIGKTFELNADPYLCGKGFHFCRKLSDVFRYYSRTASFFDTVNSTNRFCIVEVDGKVLHDRDKSVCNRITVIKELSEEDIEEHLKIEEEQKLDDVFCVDIAKSLQERYNLIIGGSVSLYLMGYKLEREEKGIDFDIIMPYYQKLENFDDFEIEEFDAKSSGNDFSSTFAVSQKGTGKFVKMDIRIKPEQRYDIVEYKGFKYKVCDVMATLEAKCRYAMEGNKKHREDVIKLLKK